ncbi:MAG: tRNA (adenosine(37)-N6)-threonylcarbamoyltransferase complex dimerization subunit type 1 TsaB [Jatrophihabitans sp.]|nr:MAG: tRNA (adenosine(37)-N6)-threonylcarbamoyltransferase complex dimerization subunit type 1 TsaB [Jatrophihabitans sp.]
MLVLALDTSSAAVTAGIVEVDDHLIGERAGHVRINARGHGELLAPGIAACLADLGIGPGELSAIVAGTGPGPYTGLRVGLVTAAMMAETLGIPTYGVCSLDAIAHAAAHHGDPVPEGDLVVVADARRKELYWARYDRAGHRIHGPDVCRPADLPLGGVVAAAGAGAGLYDLGLPRLDVDDSPAPAALVALAAGRIRAHAPSETLAPLYLRHPDAVAPGAPKPVTP